MKRRFGLLAWLAAAALLASGCPRPVAAPPVTRADYEQMQAAETEAYPRHTVVLYNLRRVLDGRLEPSQRTESMRLAASLGAGEPAVLDGLASILAEAGSPAPLRDEVLHLLLRNDYPGMARHVVQALPAMGGASPLRTTALEWLARNPQPAALADVVRLWSSEPLAGPDEPRFRVVIERATSRRWDQELLAVVNTRGCGAGGAAISLLAARLDAAMLRVRILRMPAATVAMAALQTFEKGFEYLPAGKAGFLAVVQLYRTQRRAIPIAASLSRKWRQAYGYRFNVRDFHLLSRLALDADRPALKRDELVLKLGEALEARRHVSHLPSAPGAIDDYVDLFAAHATKLTTSDLWNLYLLDELLSRPETQRQLRVVARGDRADTTSAWGGLIRYEFGRARERLYPPEKADADDRGYRPPALMGFAARDALCRFHGHFEKARNARRAGPGPEELRDARRENYYGLILTSLSEDAFCAHYYNPQGRVISLGTFPFRK